jgi:hypothetical protein
VKAVAQRLTLFALEFNQPMWDVVLIQKIVESMSLSLVPRSEHTQSRKLAITAQPPASHDQRFNDWFADPWHLGQHAAEFGCGHIQDFGFLRGHSRSRERRCPLQHRYVSNEIAFVRDCELLFDVVPPLKDLYFAPQNNSQPDIALSRFVHYISSLDDSTLSKWFKQRKLMIVQLDKGDAFGVAIKLFVLSLVSHTRNLRVRVDNQNLELGALRVGSVLFYRDSVGTSGKALSRQTRFE